MDPPKNMFFSPRNREVILTLTTWFCIILFLGSKGWFFSSSFFFLKNYNIVQYIHIAWRSSFNLWLFGLDRLWPPCRFNQPSLPSNLGTAGATAMATGRSNICRRYRRVKLNGSGQMKTISTWLKSREIPSNMLLIRVTYSGFPMLGILYCILYPLLHMFLISGIAYGRPGIDRPA